MSLLMMNSMEEWWHNGSITWGRGEGGGRLERRGRIKVKRAGIGKVSGRGRDITEGWTCHTTKHSVSLVEGKEQT